MHNFKELIVWKKARELSRDLYLLTDKFPKSEFFGLVSQIRRAAISIPSNIAEGAGRGSDIDFCRFLDIAIGSAFELENQIYLAADLGFIDEISLQNILLRIDEVEKLLFSFKKSLKTKLKIESIM